MTLHRVIVDLYWCYAVNSHLLSTKDQTLLHGRDAFFLFDALFYA